MYEDNSSAKIDQNRKWCFFTGVMSMRVKNRMENLHVQRHVGARTKYLQKGDDERCRLRLQKLKKE